MSTPFYRGDATRFALALSGCYLTFALSPFGPTQWRNTPSLHWLHSVLPWSLLAVLFAAYTVLLLWGRVEAVGAAEVIGAVLYGWELVALIVTVQLHAPANPLAIAAVFVACVMHLAAARLAIVQAVRHDH